MTVCSSLCEQFELKPTPCSLKQSKEGKTFAGILEKHQMPQKLSEKQNAVHHLSVRRVIMENIQDSCRSFLQWTSVHN